MLFVVAIVTEILKIAERQSDRRVVNVRRADVNLVMNDKPQLFVASLTHPAIDSVTMCDVCRPASVPCCGRIEACGVIL